MRKKKNRLVIGTEFKGGKIRAVFVKSSTWLLRGCPNLQREREKEPMWYPPWI